MARLSSWVAMANQSTQPPMLAVFKLQTILPCAQLIEILLLDDFCYVAFKNCS